MKNPIKNGKEVFAVLSMATVMSISMSVKVDAASNAANNEDTKNIVIEAAQNMDRSSTTNDGVDNSGSKEATAKREDNKEALAEDTKAIDPGSNEVTGEASEAKAEEPALEVPEGNKVESVRSVKAQYSQSETDKLQVSEEKTPQAQQAGETEAPKAFELKKLIPVGVYDSKNLTEEEIANVKKAVVEANSALKNTTINVTKEGKVTFTDPDGKEQTIDAADTVVKDYGIDEAKIKNYDGSERYRTTDLQPGDTNQEFYKTDEKEEKDGFKFEFKNPSKTSPSKTEYGYQITIDKKTGQRTYTKIYVTDSGLVSVDPGNKLMMGEGEKLTPESPGVNYKPGEDSSITASRRQRNLNYEASEETLKHINNKDNNSTSFGMEDNYTQDNPGVKFFAGNFALGYKVNPWPNENDKLELLKLNTEKLDPDAKYFVKGQDIDTGVKVDNIDDSAKERLVGQVYHPVTGKIVPGAKAYIGNDGNIHITMPKGAINEDGSINKDSIFSKDPSFRGIQSLDVKFFARPRTADEFKKIAETPNESGDTGTYTGSGAGTTDINHKGANVTIDKQGIDRYDHYNLIGNFKLNLDDTKYYEQKYKDQNGDSTKDHVFSKIEPGREFSINMESEFGENNENKEEFDKTPEDMKTAQDKKEAVARANLQFFLENNKDKKGNLKPEDERWKLSIGGKEVDLTKGEKEINVDNLSNLKITAPSTAKAGEFVAIPVEYTYTNGSKDIHWFHFVVQESDNNIPTYESEAGIAGKELKKTPELSQTEKDLKKLQPKSYKLAKTEYKDDKDNVWNVSIDEKTGEVKATVPDNANIPEGGAKLNVDVEVIYEEEVEVGDKKETKTYTEKTKAQFYSIPSTRQEVKKEYETKLPYETKLVYDNTIPAGKVVEEGGVVGKQKMVFSQIVVGDKKGALDENGNFVEGKEAVTTEVVEKAQDKIIKIGTKPAETTVEIPKGLDYELDYSKKGGEPEVVEEGNDGVVTIKTTRDPQTGEITVTKTTTTEAKNKKIKIPAGTEGTHEYTEKKPFTYDVQFDPDFYKNYPDAKDNYKIVTEGKVGEKTTKWTIKNSEIVGEPEIIKDTDPTNAVIKVGQKDFTGEVKYKEHFEIPFEVEIRYNKDLPAGKTNEIQKGVKGSYDVEYTQKIKNGSADGEMTKEESNKVEAKKHIIEVGTKVETPEKNYSKEVEVEVEYVYDDTKDKGVVETGEFTPGKVETKVVDKYNPETGKVEQTTEEVVTKVKQKVIVGTKDFTGKYEYNKTCPISPNVIVRENPDMEAGTSNVVQEGKDGSKTTHVTVDIKNGKVVENSEKETPGETTEAVDHIIEVGTKKTPNTCPVPENPSTPNDQKPNGPKEEESGRPGESLSTPNTPNTPNKPGEDTSSEPGKNTPNKPGENPSEDPKNPPQESSEKPKLEKENDPKLSETEKVKEAEKAKEADEEIETEEAKVLNQVKKEEDEEASRVGNEVGKAKIAGDDKAPKTGDAGLMAETASAGLASGLLLLLGRFKRKKEDEE